MKQFEDQYFTRLLQPSPEFSLAYKAWAEYYFNCEEYDRKICTGFSFYGFEKTAVPGTRFEFALINKNARKERAKVIETLNQAGIVDPIAEQARKAAGNEKHEYLREFLGR